jgi:hypothetical protein
MPKINCCEQKTHNKILSDTGLPFRATGTRFGEGYRGVIEELQRSYREVTEE